MRIPILLLAWSCMIASAQQDFFPEQIGDIEINREPATWRSPEAVLRDLQSSDDIILGKALDDAGVPIGGPPDQTELRYAGIGGQRAAVLVVATNYSELYAAVAVPSANGWRRVAVLHCWGKAGFRKIDDFVQLESQTGRGMELVVHMPPDVHHNQASGFCGRKPGHETRRSTRVPVAFSVNSRLVLLERSTRVRA